MKRYLIVVIFFLGLSTFAFSQEIEKSTQVTTITTENFKVYGNCGMCKRTIEGAISGLDGVAKGTWDVDSKNMSVEFDSTILSLDDIKQKIADVGYDSDSHRAKENVYQQLPGCCQYERPQ